MGGCVGAAVVVVVVTGLCADTCTGTCTWTWIGLCKSETSARTIIETFNLAK